MMEASTNDAPSDSTTIVNMGKDIDTFLSQEMTALSFQERNLVQEEVHGVATVAVEETPDLLRTAMQELEVEIERIPNKSAYVRAVEVDGGKYVRSRDFRLKFLRADLFDARKAATRLTARCDLLFKYFGEQALQRTLRFDDLSKKEQAIVRAGSVQLLPVRDRSGRMVEFHYSAMTGRGVTTENRVRVVLYHYEAASEDVETQRKGIVVVARIDNTMIDNYLQAAPEVKKDVIDSLTHIPIRYSAQHYCILDDSPFVMQMFKGLWGFINRSKDERFRVQIYSGLEMETKYKLMTFGVPMDLPITHTGNLKVKNHLKWIQMRKAIDEERRKDPSGATIGIVCPANADVLFETGGGRSNHFGNIEFVSIMEQKIGEHGFDAKFGEHYYEELIAWVREKNGRFLERDPCERGWWVEITDKDILQKRLYSALYEHKKRIKARWENRQCVMSESLSLSAPYHGKKRQKLCQHT